MNWWKPPLNQAWFLNMSEPAHILSEIIRRRALSSMWTLLLN